MGICEHGGVLFVSDKYGFQVTEFEDSPGLPVLAKLVQNNIIFFEVYFFEKLGGYIKSDKGYPPTSFPFPASNGISVACAAPISFLKLAITNFL